MKTFILLLLACSMPAIAQTPKAPTASKYRTAQEIKVFWFNKMPVPRTMDKDYKEMTVARAEFIADVRAGKYDDSAEKTAAQYNAELAMKNGDEAKVTFYNAKIEQCDRAIEAKAKAEAANAEAAAAKAAASRNNAAVQELQSQLREINSKLTDVENILR